MCPDPNCRRKIYDTESVAKESLFLGRKNQVELKVVSQKMDTVSSKIDDVHEKVERIINQHDEEKIKKIQEQKDEIQKLNAEIKSINNGISLKKWQVVVVFIGAIFTLIGGIMLFAMNYFIK